MMYYGNILKLMDTINEWNEKLKSLLAGKTDNVFIGMLVIGAAFIITGWAINYFSKR